MLRASSCNRCFLNNLAVVSLFFIVLAGLWMMSPSFARGLVSYEGSGKLSNRMTTFFHKKESKRIDPLFHVFIRIYSRFASSGSVMGNHGVGCEEGFGFDFSFFSVRRSFAHRTAWFAFWHWYVWSRDSEFWWQRFGRCRTWLIIIKLRTFFMSRPMFPTNPLSLGCKGIRLDRISLDSSDHVINDLKPTWFLDGDLILDLYMNYYHSRDCYKSWCPQQVNQTLCFYDVMDRCIQQSFGYLESCYRSDYIFHTKGWMIFSNDSG